jgi:hypothetical protein
MHSLLPSLRWALVAGGLVAAAAACSAQATLTEHCVPVACGAGGASQRCTTDDQDGVCYGIEYRVAGKTFACATCADCFAAEAQSAQECVGPPTGGGTGVAPYVGTPEGDASDHD